jgi:hypothetical protein
MNDRREATVGDAMIRMRPINGLVKGIVVVGRDIKAEIEGESTDEVWRQLHVAAARLNPKFFGFDGARARFLRFFPDGFETTDYAHRERDYKIEAKTKLDTTVPLEKAETGAGFGEAVWSVFQTNLLFQIEKMRVREFVMNIIAQRPTLCLSSS